MTFAKEPKPPLGDRFFVPRRCLSAVPCLLLPCLLVAAWGCARQDPAIGVSGTVTIDGVTLDNVAVSFIPTGKTFGRPGRAMTDASGRYTIANDRGRNGIVAGTYRVVVSRPVRSDGSPLGPGESMEEAGATETVDPSSSDPGRSTLSAVVDDSSRVFDWNVKSQPGAVGVKAGSR